MVFESESKQYVRRSSTMSTDSTISMSSSESCSISSSNSSGSKKRKVRFSRRPKVNIFYKVEPATCEEDSLWWSTTHCQQNREKAFEQGQEWLNKGYGILLQDTFSNPDDRDKLDTFVQLPGDDYVRGLEYYVCPKLRDERKIARKTLIQTLVNTEVELKLAMTYTSEEIAEELAELSQELSEKARNFAKRMGNADELGEKLGENPELPHFILPGAATRSDSKPANELSLPLSIGTSLVGRLVSSVATALGA